MEYLASNFKGKALGQYKGMVKGILWECDRGHQFDTRPNDVSNGHWCPVCGKTISQPEVQICEFIKSLDNKILIETQFSPFENKKKKLDIYLPEFKLAIEHHGLPEFST